MNSSPSVCKGVNGLFMHSGNLLYSEDNYNSSVGVTSIDILAVFCKIGFIPS